MGLFHFAVGHEPPGRLWDPPGVRKEDNVPVGIPCFPPHLHDSGHSLFRRLQVQLRIATVVHEQKGKGTPLFQGQAVPPLKECRLLELKPA